MHQSITTAVAAQAIRRELLSTFHYGAGCLMAFVDTRLSLLVFFFVPLIFT